MKYFLLIIVTTALASCKDLGRLVDEKKSDSYFINPAGQIIFCQDGNWFELGIDSMQADAQSFQVLSDFIAKDKNSVFYRGSPQKQVDTKSFYVENEIPKDRFHAYYTDETLGFKIIEGADAKTFEYVSKNSIWSRDKDNYFFDLKKVKVDRATFQIMNDCFAKDKDSVYAFSILDTFQSVGRNTGDISVINKNYIKSSNAIYYLRDSLNTSWVTKNIFTSFHSIKVISDDIIHVNDRIIYRGKLIPDADANSFQLYPSGDAVYFYARDKKSVYYLGDKIKDADVKTFTPMEFGYGKDAAHVYYQTKILKGADSKNFRQITSDGPLRFEDKLGNKYDLNGNVDSVKN